MWPRRDGRRRPRPVPPPRWGHLPRPAPGGRSRPPGHRAAAARRGRRSLRPNDYGRTPLDYARDPRIKALLKESGARFEETRKKLDMEERRKFPLEKRLKEVIVGQDGPINIVSSAIR